MDKYLRSKKPTFFAETPNTILPPLNTDIRFSDKLNRHIVTDKEMPYTPVVTVGANTPLLAVGMVTFGYNPGDYSHEATEHPHAIHIHTELPEKFSWCEIAEEDSKLIKIKKSLISKPKAQYACGACFAFCVSQVFSDCLVVSGAVGWAPHISETWLLANLPSQVHNGCGGGNPATIAPYLETLGALDSSCIDYSWCESDRTLCASVSSSQHFNASTLAQRLNTSIPKNGCWFNQKRFLYKLDKGSEVFFISPEAPTAVFRETVKTHILDFGPCVGGYVVLKNFMSGAHTNPSLPTKGLYFEKCEYNSWFGGISWGNTSTTVGLHAIAIVGWGEEHDVEYGPNKRGTVPYWHCRNSWGEDWGFQKGMFKMAMYPFNVYSQFDKEVMTSLGGPVGSMVLLRATKHPSVVSVKEVDEKYKRIKRTLPDTYYQAPPEDVVKYNRKNLFTEGGGGEELTDIPITETTQTTNILGIVAAISISAILIGFLLWKWTLSKHE